MSNRMSIVRGVAAAGVLAIASETHAQASLQRDDLFRLRSVSRVSPASDAAIAEALVWARPMPPADAPLPAEAQKRLDEYRQRERSFKSGLAPPRGGSAEEHELYEKRIAIERVIFSLFPRRDGAKVAAGFALDADLDREAPFIDELLRDLPVPWLAPYLNLIAGHRKLRAGETEDARRQLARARDGGHPLIRIAAEYFLNSPTHQVTNSPITAGPLSSLLL